ncbi:MAG: hypothetical protein LBS60_12620 [Deltaproteobacteria bacterium]|nr:hypothetical protein [Deltaproteobacteria bacterium]
MSKAEEFFPTKDDGLVERLSKLESKVEGLENSTLKAQKENAPAIASLRGDLNRSLDKIDSKIELVNRNIKALDAKIDTKIDTKIELVNRDIKALDAKIDSKFELVNRDIKALDTKIDTKIDLMVKEVSAKIDKLTALTRFGVGLIITSLAGVLALLIKS